MSTKKRARQTDKSKGSKTEGKVVGSPLPMTREEVAAMAAGEADAKAVVKRLHKHSTSLGTAKRKSSKFAPATIGKAEMAALRKLGALPKALRERIEKTSARDTIRTTKNTASKAEPTEPPPTKAGGGRPRSSQVKLT